jgi:hypothetical protein
MVETSGEQCSSAHINASCRRCRLPASGPLQGVLRVALRPRSCEQASGFLPLFRCCSHIHIIMSMVLIDSCCSHIHIIMSIRFQASLFDCGVTCELECVCVSAWVGVFCVSVCLCICVSVCLCLPRVRFPQARRSRRIRCRGSLRRATCRPSSRLSTTSRSTPCPDSSGAAGSATTRATSLATSLATSPATSLATSPATSLATSHFVAGVRSGLEVVDASLQQHARAELISAVVAAPCSSGAHLRFSGSNMLERSYSPLQM